MIGIKLWGGLGNQLFQYAFGRSLSIMSGEELFFYQIGEDRADRPIQLTCLNVSIRFLEAKDLAKFYRYSNSRLLYRIERRVLKSFPSLNRSVLVEPNLSYIDPGKFNERIFDGYWQSYKYFDTIKELLQKELKLKEDISLPVGLLHEINQLNSVSVHIRRGDYLSGKSRSIYHHLNESYYLNSISAISKFVEDPVFFIFSDDTNWVKENFNFQGNHNIRYAEHSFSPASCIDFSLMKECKHNIIANSTFSWWAAWLNSYTNKKVIAPAIWYKDDRVNDTIEELLPAEWIRIS
jgi:hypothetical protein